MTVVVIGSGPAGAAAARALCDAGVRVTVLDAGDRIEAEGRDLFDTLARSEPDRWPAELTRRARGAFPADIKQVPLKPAYGSLFPYVRDDPDLQLTISDSDAVSSLAYGGLSNAWGASILPYRGQDIEDWPISPKQLRPHYEAVQRFVPVAAEHDELCESLPLHTDRPIPLPPGEQAERLLRHMRRHTAALAAAGFTFGASRVAVVADNDDGRHCRHCGLCLYGCPYGSIYNAAHTIDALRREQRIEYRGGIYVDRLTEAGDKVVVDFHKRGRHTAPGQLIATRVFVACGAISSTRLMFSSMKLRQHSQRMQDSQYFVIPVISRQGAPVSVATQGNTLAQVFVELEGGHATRHTVHLQIYGYNDIILSALAKRLRMPAARLERIARPVLGRLLIIQGFLHSADSPGLTFGYQADRVRIVGEDPTPGARRVRRLVRRLALHSPVLGLVPAPRLVHVGRPGKSNHLGGSLPMRSQPGAFETDVLGRVAGWKRVHVVDASVFPCVPATTITLSAMANAHRIATAAVKLGC